MGKTIRLIAVVMALVGAGMLAGSAALALRTRAFLARAEGAAGTVTRLERSESTDSDNRRSVYYYPYVRFELPSGEVHEFRGGTGSNPPAWAIGERVDVLYDPARPAEARIRGFSSLWLGSVILGGLGLLFALVGGGIFGVRWLGARRAGALRQGGTRVQAVFQSVERNEALKVNGRSPWRVVCQWIDPATRKLHVFESENLWYDPTPHIQAKEIAVFIEPGNPRRYLVDLSFLPPLAE